MRTGEWTDSVQLVDDDAEGMTATARVSRTRVRIGVAVLSALVPGMVTFLVASVVGFFVWDLATDEREMLVQLGTAGARGIAYVVVLAGIVALAVGVQTVRRRSSDLFGRLVPLRTVALEWRPTTTDTYRSATKGFLRIDAERVELDAVRGVVLARRKRTVAGLRREVAELTLLTRHGRRPVLPPFIGERERIEAFAQRLADRLGVPLDADVADIFPG